MDGIITGTGYGCLEDTTTFLKKITELNEEALSPTPFMQSTHNTIGSVIALLIQCTGYNQTFVHSSFSFEHALLDALMLLDEKQVSHVLVGGVDEWTDVSHTIHSRFGKYRSTSPQEFPTVAGEGAVYFRLSQNKTKESVASVNDVRTITQLNKTVIEQFLADNGLKIEQIDLLAWGAGDKELQESGLRAPNHRSTFAFKNICGEYSTASAFGMAVGVQSFYENLDATTKGHPEHVLVCNGSFGSSYSLILLQRC
jgi:3-oxoacyl-[acyl-carrier-protein] synthase II